MSDLQTFTEAGCHSCERSLGCGSYAFGPNLLMKFIAIPPPFLAKAVAQSFKELLSMKHLYQSVDVSRDFVGNEVACMEYARNRELIIIKKATSFWNISLDLQPPNNSLIETSINLSNIDTFCHECRLRKPFSLFAANSRKWGCPSDQWNLATTGQSFHLGFKCQGYQSATVDFLVTRSVMKLTLSGRWPIEEVKVPNHIPKCIRKYYTNAIIADHTGMTLCALFMLRTVIEQFWYSLGLRNGEERTTGVELGERYKAKLPDEFKSQFPSLSDIYDSVSDALHTANADVGLFKKSIED
jgi:hypothetical protein